MLQNIFNIARMLALGGMMILVSACGGSQTSGGNAQPSETTSSQAVGDETGGILELTVAKPEKLEGVYKRDGVGIRFMSAKSGEKVEFLLETLSGQDLIRADGDGTELKMTLNEKYSEVAKYADVRQMMNVTAKSKSSQPKMSLALQVRGDREAAVQAMSQPEMSLLPWLARALGQFGYYGKTHPAAMPLLMMGRSFADMKSISIPSLPKPEGIQLEDPEAAAHQAAEGAKAYSEDTAQSWWDCSGWGTPCVLGNCPGDNCIGMCGPNCECWWWICGDCCAHMGCYVHDLYCWPNCWANFWQFFIGGCNPVWL